MSAALVRADARRIPLADASVDLVVTSPPFLNLRSYRDGGEHFAAQIGTGTLGEFLDDLWAVMAEVKRVMKPSASAWIELGDSYTDKCLNVSPHRFVIGCVERLGFILRAEVIWNRPNGLPESVTDRVRRSHSVWFHLVRSPRYFSAVDEVREAHAPASLNRYQYDYDAINGDRASAYARTESERDGFRKDVGPNPLGKLPGSVWTIPSEPLIIPEAVQRHYDLPDHFAAFPQEWPRRIILGWSPNGVCVECGEGRRPVVAKTGVGRSEDTTTWVETRTPERGWGDRQFQRDVQASITGYACACSEDVWQPGLDGPDVRRAVVLDPFSGTGTTAMVARALGRFGVGIDLSADYNRLARWRIWESQHGEKAMQRTHRENQTSLALEEPA